MTKEILFKLFGDKADRTIKALKKDKTLHWDIMYVEGRIVLECSVE